MPSERLRTDNGYNLLGYHELNTAGLWNIPILEPCDVIPDDLIGFNQAKTSKSFDLGVHFYIDDYQFERVWRQPGDYLGLLGRFQCVFTPDFSLYMDMPQAMKLWNVYRSRYLGAWWQSQGINVIPTLQWTDRDSFTYCFDGLPANSVVSVSTLGVIGDPKAESVWTTGMNEAIQRLEPSLVLHYGSPVPGFDWGETSMIRYSNHIIERLEHGRKRKQQR